MKFAQILWDKVHYIFEADSKPNYPPDSDGNPIVIIDITGRDDVRERMGYNAETGEFSEPEELVIPNDIAFILEAKNR